MFSSLIYFCFIVQVLCNLEPGFIDDETFKEAKYSGSAFAVYLYNNDVSNVMTKNVLNSVQLSVDKLESAKINIGILDCDVSKQPICKEPDTLNHLLLYKSSQVVTNLSPEEVQTVLNVEVYSKHHLLLPHMKKINNSKEWEETQKEYSRKSDMLLYYVPAFGTIEHLRMVNSALTLPKHLGVFYTFDQTIVGDGNKAWYFSCLTSENDKCERSFSSEYMSGTDFDDFFTKKGLVTIMASSDNYVARLKELVNKGKDVLVLIAGKRKFSVAESLARKVTDKMGGGVSSFVVDGATASHRDIRSRIEDDRIFALVSPGKLDAPVYRNIGFLESEEVDELVTDVMEALAEQDDTLSDKADEEERERDELDLPEEVLDDSIAFSLHQTSHVKDLYYFDYKTIPRLTDKTYEAVTESNEYAVILFTLEFNQKALAALVNFVEIHNAYKKKTKSPMYRVECYNWPDICAKAKVHTSPRMFFYPPGTTESFEYTGMWDKVKMKDAIVRYSNPSVIVVHKKEDILPYLPVTVRSVVGFFESDDGTAQFRKAAEKLRKDYQFIEIHGDVAKFVADQYKIKFGHRTIAAFEHQFPKHRLGTFKSEQDILDFCSKEFAGPELQELSIYSFVDVLKDAKPMFIYFWDIEDGENRIRNTELKNTIQEITSKGTLTNEVLFMWMDATPQSTGAFVLGRYNYRSKLEGPIVAFFDKKGSVMLKSCSKKEDCSNTKLEKWIQDCLKGEIDTTYTLDKEEWKPRLEGFDFLEMMKEEGTYPEESRRRININEEEEKTTATSRGGRTVLDGHGKHEEKVSEKNEEKEKKEPMAEANKSPEHSEL